MPTTRSITDNGITWGFTHDVTYGQYVTGDYWVLGNINGGVELSSITPQVVLGAAGSNGYSNSFNDTNGSQINPHWIAGVQAFPGASQNEKIHGFHGLGLGSNGCAEGYKRLLNWALNNDQPLSNSNKKVLPVNNSLVSCESLPSNLIGQFRGIRRMRVLTCVSSIPADGSFRPAYASLDKTSYYTSSNVNYDYVANIQASSASSLMPSATYFSGLSSVLRYPTFNHSRKEYPAYLHNGLDDTGGNDYGEYFSVPHSIAFGYVNTNLLSSANKKVIINMLVQRGIDAIGTVERCDATSSTIGYANYDDGGGQNNSFELAAIALAGFLYPGTAKERVKSRLQFIANLPAKIWQRDTTLYNVSSAQLSITQSRLSGYSQYNSISSILSYQTSDIGLPGWAGSETYPIKLWSRPEFYAVASSLPGYNPSHSDVFYTPYRHCCTMITWAPYMFAVKAMGIEKTLYNSIQPLAYEVYNRRQTTGPYPEIDPATGNFTYTSRSLDKVSGTSQISVGSISTEGLTRLYNSWVKHSFKASRGVNSYAAVTPVSGIESIGVGTTSSIYIEAPSAFKSGQTNIIKFYGLSGLTWPQDLAGVLYCGVEDAPGVGQGWLDNPMVVEGVRAYAGRADGALLGDTLTGDVGTFKIPVNATPGAEFIVQGYLSRNYGTQIFATNALKIKVV